MANIEIIHEVVNVSVETAGIQGLQGPPGPTTWAGITDKPATFPPSTHSHTITDLPVAASGVSNTTQLVRADDSRLSNQRVPTDAATASLRSAANMTGGGNVSVSATNEVKWTARFILISNGMGAHYSTAGYFDIGPTPASGTVITGVGGAGNATTTASGIPLPQWSALYYILPIGSGSSFLGANLRVAHYSAALVVPETWVLLAVHGEGSHFRFGNGISLQPGQSWTANDRAIMSGGPAGGDLTGTYPNPTIGTGKVTGTHILDSTITDVEIAAANKDGIATTASMRTLGTGAQQAAAGNHLHTGTYEPAITAGTTAQYRRGDKTWQTLDKAAVGLANVPNVDSQNATNLTSGTVADARLSANVPLLGATQTFAGANTFNATVVMNGNSYGSGEDTYFAWDNGANNRLGFSKKVGAQPKLSYANSTFAITQYVGQTNISTVNAQTDRLTIDTAGAVAIPGTLTVTGLLTSTAGFSGPGGSLTALNGTNISSGTVADTRLSTNVSLLNTPQTITGVKTFTVAPIMAPPTLSPAGDHGYISFRSRDATPTTRTAWVGVGSGGSTTFSITNEMTNGGIDLVPNGTGVVSAQGGFTLNSGVFTGNGSGLTTLNGSNISSGTININRIPTGQTSTTVPLGNDARFTDSRTPTGTAGGDLTGTYPNPTVAALAITDAKVAAANKDGAVGTPSMRTLGTGALQALAGNTRLDTLAAPTAVVNLNSQRITNLADPTASQDAASKAYVDSFVQGLDAKPSARLGTTGNVALTGLQTIDGIAGAVNDRVLVKDQTAGAENGIYTMQTGAWVRSTDTDTSAEVTPGMYVFVEQGTVNADTGWVLTSDGAITLGTTALTFVQFSGAGQLNAGAGMTKTGNNFDVVGTANRITVNADNVDISSAYVGQTSITTLGTVATGTWNATTISVAKGGTGAVDAATARTNLGAAATSHTHVATTDLTATGTKDATTFLRGDNTWGVPVGTTYPTDAAAGTGSLRTLGTGALQAAAGNDSRFTDTRTPSNDADIVHKAGAETITGTKTFNGTPITWTQAGIAPPSFTTRSAGTKVVYYPDVAAGAVDYATGVDASTLWNSIPQAISAHTFKWYAGTTEQMKLDGTGVLTVGGQVVVKTNDSRLTDTRTPSNDADIVHKAGTETISGSKTFSSEIIGPATGNVLKVGDDARIADINLGHVLGVVSQTDTNRGGVQFGATANNARIEATGTALTVTATTVTLTGTISGNGSGLTTLNGANISSGTVDIARLPVATSGTSNTTQVVRADDSRLSNARTPTTHTHTLTDLPDAWVKRAVRVASIANIDLTTGTALTIDGIVTVAGDRVLVKNQTTTSQNGIYQVNAGAWTRVTDADTSAEVAGATVSIDEGTQGGQIWTTTFKSTDTLGTTAMTWYKMVDTSQVGVSGGVESFVTAGTTAQYRRGDKTWQTLDKAAVGLANVPNVDSQNATNLTSGTVAIARIPTGQTSTTVPLGNDARFTDARTPLAHTHVIADVTSLQTTLDAKFSTAGTGLTSSGGTVNVIGTAGRIVANADSIDIDSAYVGQSTITTVGTIATGTWNATAISIAKGGTGATTVAAARTALSAAGVYKATLGALTAGAYLNITHNLNTDTPVVVFIDTLTLENLALDWKVVDVNTIAVRSDVNFAVSGVRVGVVG